MASARGARAYSGGLGALSHVRGRGGQGRSLSKPLEAESLLDLGGAKEGQNLYTYSFRTVHPKVCIKMEISW